MSIRKLVVAVVALASLALGLSWLLRTSPHAPMALPVQAEGERPLEPSVALPPMQSQAQTREPAAAIGLPKTWTPTAEDLVDAQWVEGRVVLPSGLPSGEWVTLETLGRPFNSGSRHKVILGGDGAFRLAFPKGSSSGKLHLENRFLALEDSTLSLPRTDGALELRPELRGVLKGRIVLTPIAEPRRKALAGTRLKLWSKAWGESAARKGRAPDTRLDEQGSFEFDLVPGAPDWELTLSAGDFAEARRAPITIIPGQVVDLELATQLLALLRGVVVDTAGAPLSSATFELAIRGTAEPKLTRRMPNSKVDGTFELPGIPLDAGWVLPSHPGYVTRATELTQLGEGQVVEGLKIVLERGQAITGKISWPDGTPAAGSQVSAMFLEEQKLGESKRSVLRSPRARTDDAGTFRIEGLPETSLRVIATAVQGEQSARTVWNAVVELDAPPQGELALVLARACTIRGRVHDTVGNPPADFSIEAHPIWRLKLSDAWMSMAAPDDSKSPDGSFVLGGLFPTTYEITASVPGTGNSNPQRVELPGSGEPLEIVVVTPGMASGVVVDPSGNAVAGARVRSGQGFDSPGALCDAAGRFRMEKVAPGSCQLVASAKGWAPSPSLRIDVASNVPTEGLVLQLRTPGRIAGEVLDAQGRAEADRPVRLDGVGPDHDACTDASGRFLFEDLAVGQYSLCTRATAAELAALPKNSGQRWVNSNDPVPREAQVKLGEGEIARVVLKPATLANPILVRGRVACSGKPVEGCAVSAYPMFAGGGRMPPPTTTAADGRFQFQVDGAGQYSFSLDPAGASANTRVHIAIEARTIVELVLELPAGRIVGVTVDREGRHISGVQLHLHGEGHADIPVFGMGGSTESDVQGHFEFAHVAAGTYSITGEDGSESLVRHGKTKLDGIAVRDGAALEDMKFVLLPGCRVEGTVRRPDGLPGAGARIQVREESGSIWQQDWSADPSGQFVVDGLPPGRYSFQARTGTLVSQETEALGLTDAVASKVDLALQEATDLNVQFQDASGKPCYAWLEVLDAHGRQDEHVSWPDNESRDKFPPLRCGLLAPGKYTLRSRWADGSTREQELKLSGERALSLTLRSSN